MDRKSILIIAISVVLLLTWTPVINKLFPPKALPPGVTNTVESFRENTNRPATLQPPVLEAASTNQIRYTTPAEPEQLIEVTNALAHYTFTSHGGGLKEIELLKYPETTTTRR